MLWRFRYSLTSEARALTKFLKCVDWGDAQEARQAADLMQAWAPIAIADALELLSPDFPNEQVTGPLQTLFPLSFVLMMARLPQECLKAGGSSHCGADCSCAALQQANICPFVADFPLWFSSMLARRLQ